jgi:glycosyltransferase involved in cell wall biosynthesis
VIALAMLVSAIIPAYNRSASIGAAIESVLSQGDQSAEGAHEIIIVDDGSQDDLAGALGRFAGPIRLIRHDRNQGAAAARNTGAAAAQSEYLAFLDSDDTWLPNKLAAQIAFMRANGNAVSCTACELVRPDGSTVAWPRYATGRLTLADIAWGCLLSPGTTMVCERRMFEEIGPFDTRIKRREDWDWLLRLTRRHDLAYVATPLARREPSAFSNYHQALDDLDILRAKHGANLPLSVRRSFAAALAFETAAARYGQGDRIAALAAGLRSLWLSPGGNPSLRAIIAKRFAR